MELLKNKGVIYIIKLLVLFLVLYGANIFFIGVTSPTGSTYSAFLDKYLNYIDAWRAAILHTANLLTPVFGVSSYVDHPFALRAYQGAGVRMVYSCIGYGVTSFWVAFVLANEGKFTRKLVWIIAGAAGIFVINSFRVALLLAALQQHWKVNRYMDHHTMFNIAAYALIFLLMFLYTKKPGSSQNGSQNSVKPATS